jgi:uncharacterized membrane protein
MESELAPLITNDAVVLGLLTVILGAVFWTSTAGGAGSMKTGSVFIYILVATIGMNMDITAIARNPEFFLIGFIWIIVHASLLILVAIAIKAPVFFLAVGSQANIGGAASAPVVASAFHPSLAPVGVLLAVVGYIVGTWGAWLTGQILRVVAGA